VYVFDPEGNRIETYWNTGLEAKQPYGARIDLDKPADELIKEIEASVANTARPASSIAGLLHARKQRNRNHRWFPTVQMIGRGST